MARIVALSSLVAYGHVGLRATVPALERLGHDVVALPTVVLSNHGAYAHVAGTPIDPTTLERMTDSLEANGWLSAVDIVITGYVPSLVHVNVAASLVERIRTLSPALTYICDPVFGDEPKGLYVALETANAIRDRLLPIADIATPNAFELAWLSNQPVSSIPSAISAARTLRPRRVLATSIPAGNHELATLLIGPTSAHATRQPLRTSAPSGTGDLLTGLLAGYIASGMNPTEALAQAGAWIEACLDASAGNKDLNVSPLAGLTPAPLALHPA